MDLRPPSFDHGVVSFVWALVLSVYLWIGMLAVGVGIGTAVVISGLSFCAIFLFVRLRGEDVPGQAARTRGRMR